jgi:glycosyltransferase involved in cell wall biosynthesis
MKILLVCQYFYPEQFRVNDICFALVKNGYEVTVLTGLPNYPSGTIDKKYRWFKKRKEMINGATVIRSSLIGRGKSTKRRLVLNYLSFVIAASIKALYMKKNFDLILVYQLSPVTMAIPGILLKKITKKPLIIYCHDLWPESLVARGILDDSRVYHFVLKISQWIYKSADEIFTSSKMFEQYFKEVIGIEKEVKYLPVYAESLFENIESQERQSDETNLVFAGNISEMQSIETIIFAANILKNESNILFHIVGDGSSKSKCEALSKELGLKNVIFHGKYPVTEMPRFYSMADAFLVTLKANKVISYTLPNKVQSYMAAGKPIIGAIDGETNLVIKEADCGLCVNAEDSEGLARVIKQFVCDKDKHQYYGENAKKYYDNNFSKKIYIMKINALLQEAIEQRRRK